MKTLANYLLNKQWILNIVMLFLSKEKQERILIAQVRGEFSFFGHDVSDMTDRDIKDMIIGVGKFMGETGLTMDEAIKASNALFKINYNDYGK